MQQEDYDFFKNNGYLSLGKVLSDDEVARFEDAFDRDRRDFSRSWTTTGIWQTENLHALLTAPEFDEIVRHPVVLEALEALMCDEVCFSEIGIRYMGPYEGEPVPAMRSWDGPVGYRWHRDGGTSLMWPEHPLRLGYAQVMVYLCDVSDTTHSFAISPESADSEILNIEGQLARNGMRELHGCAGTALLFDASRVHTVVVRPTQSERKSVQTYYGHRHREFLSEQSYTPAALCRDHPDEETRGFYGVLNNKTREFLKRTAGRADVPVNEALEILADIKPQPD